MNKRHINYVLITIFSLVVLTSCGGEKKEEKETIKLGVQEEEKQEKAEEVAVVLTDEEVQPLLTKNTCIACHHKENKLVGPAFIEIAKRNYSDERIVELIYKPEPQNWPDFAIPMVALPHVPKGEALQIAGWINSLN